MKLEIKKKTKIMLLNFPKNFQFATSLKLKNFNIEQAREAKVLGTILSDDLLWKKKTVQILDSSVRAKRHSSE